MTAREFDLIRDVDVSHVTGTGRIASGWQLDTGWVVLVWPTPIPSVAVFPDLDTMLAAHGHQGQTRAVFRELTGLHRVADLIASGLPYIDVVRRHASKWVEVLVLEREEWLAWIAALGGSPDAATRKEWRGELHDWQWRWPTPDGSVLVTYLSKGDS